MAHIQTYRASQDGIARAAMMKSLDDASFYIACGNCLFGRQGAGRRLMHQWYRKAEAAKADAIGWASR